MKTIEKTYRLSYLDRKNNELKADEITAYSIQEARKTRDKIFGNCMINDCVKITVKKA
jgi:hypothetical protein